MLFYKVKNLERVLEAFAVVAQTLANVMMVFVGDGPELATLQDKVSRLGLINQTLFVGHREGDDLLVWYLLAWGSLLASTSETYGAVVNESLLAGVPVLCSRRAGANMLIQEGKNGHVFDPYNVENLASVMRLVLSQGTPADIVGQIQRNSLMPVPFERDVNSFVKAVNYVASVTN